MTLNIAIKSEAGLVLASESRRMFFIEGDPRQSEDVTRYAVADDELKVFELPAPHRWVALAFSGEGTVKPPAGLFDTDSITRHLPEIEDAMPPERARVAEYAERASAVLKRWGDYTITAAGFDPGETTGRVYTVVPPDAPVEQHVGSAGGITASGARDFVDRLLLGYDPRLRDAGLFAGVKNLDQALALPVALAPMPLDACAMLAGSLIELSIVMNAFTATGIQGIGGAVDVATITAADGLRWLRRKPAAPAKSPEASWVPMNWTAPEISVNTSSDPRRASSYTARFR